VPILIPGMTINERSETSVVLNRSRISALLFVVTRSTIGSAAPLTLVKLDTLADIATKIGTVTGIVQGSFERAKAIAPNAELWAIAVDTGATVLAKLQSGLNSILTAALALDMAAIVVPEAGELAIQADETALFGTAEAVAATNGWDWMYFHNFRQTINTKALADAASLLITSPQGNSSKYYGYSRDGANRLIPLAIDAAAWLVQLSQTRDLFRSPAGEDCLVPVASVDAAYQVTFADGGDIINNRRGYNYFWAVRGVWYVWNCATGAVSPSNADRLWDNINTRLASTTLQARLAVAGLRSLFKPSNRPTGDASALGKTATAYAIAKAFDDEGGFAVPPLDSSGNQPPRFRLSPRDVGSGKQELDLRCYFIQSDQQVILNLIATQAP
jgi:hypothetical protein